MKLALSWKITFWQFVKSTGSATTDLHPNILRKKVSCAESGASMNCNICLGSTSTYCAASGLLPKANGQGLLQVAFLLHTTLSLVGMVYILGSTPMTLILLSFIQVFKFSVNSLRTRDTSATATDSSACCTSR